GAQPRARGPPRHEGRSLRGGPRAGRPPCRPRGHGGGALAGGPRGARLGGPRTAAARDPHPGNVVVPLAGTEEPATLIDWGDTTRGDPASDLGALLLHAPSDALLGTYRDEAAWTGIDDDITWDALVARSWAWATRMALSLVTAYPIEHGLGATGHRLLAS